MSQLPRIIVSVHYAEGEHNRALGQYDVTRSVLAILSEFDRLNKLSSNRVRKWDLVNALPQKCRLDRKVENFTFPDYSQAVSGFMKQFRSVAELKNLHTLLEAEFEYENSLKEVRKELDMVTAATWSSTVVDLVTGGLAGDRFVDSIEEFLDDRGYEDFIVSRKSRQHPLDEEIQFRMWQRSNLCPYVFGTKALVWEGLSASAIRECYQKAGKQSDSSNARVWPSVERMIESSLEMHPDGALERVLGLKDITSFVTRWAEFAGTGCENDLALEGKITEWNARQSLTSYIPDTTIVHPVFEGGRREEAIAFCHRQAKALEIGLELIQESSLA